MAHSPTETRFFESFDGTRLAWREMGDGRPVMLIHGYFSNAFTNWIRFGHANVLADAGFEAIMLDLRAHGDSEAPHDATAYPPGVLLRDLAALVAALELDEFALAGFSLGARIATGCVLAGMAPRRLVLAGMGLEGLAGWDERAGLGDTLLDVIEQREKVQA